MVMVGRDLPRGVHKLLSMDGLTYQLIEGFKNAVEKHNTSAVMVFDGRSGMGKTTLANQVGIVLDPNYNLDKIHYEPHTFLEALANAKKGDFILFDEAMLISSRTSLTSINTMVIQAMSMIRSKNIYVGFCVNSIFDLDKNLAISRADVLFHVYGQTLIHRGTYATFFKGVDGVDRLKDLYLKGKKFYDYSRPRANYLARFSSEFVVEEKEYEKRKQKGIDSFLKGGGLSGKKEKGRNNLIEFCLKQSRMTKEEIIDVTPISQAQLYKIMQGNPWK